MIPSSATTKIKLQKSDIFFVPVGRQTEPSSALLSIYLAHFIKKRRLRIQRMYRFVYYDIFMHNYCPSILLCLTSLTSN